MERMERTNRITHFEFLIKRDELFFGNADARIFERLEKIKKEARQRGKRTTDLTQQKTLTAFNLRS